LEGQLHVLVVEHIKEVEEADFKSKKFLQPSEKSSAMFLILGRPFFAKIVFTNFTIS